MASPRQSYSVLAKREVARAAEWNNHASPYCAIRSKTHSACNRYSDILAYDRTAIRTKDGGYLNANVVRDHKGRWWVAAQAPTPATFHAFFSSIIDRTGSSHPLIRSAPKRRAVLVQLTDWTERGLGKADPYLPPTTTTVGNGTERPISLETLATTTEEDIASTKSILRAGYIGSEEHIEITHYRFVLWPDHGVPSGKAVGAMRRLVEEVERRREDSEIWIHCSAGVGRTGTFIALASLLGQPLQPSGQSHSSALGPLPPGVKEDEIAATVDQLREWRGMLVQSPHQFGLLYQCMADR